MLMTAVSALIAQSPGGVSANLTMWVKADAGTSATGGLLDSWTYMNDNTKQFLSTGTNRPTLTASSVNFLPALTFTGAQLMDGPTGANAPITAGNDSYSVFIVWNTTIDNNYQRLWQQRGNDDLNNDACAISTWNNGLYGDETATNPWDFTITRPYTKNTWNISEINLMGATPTNDLEIVDDRNFSTGSLFITTDNTAGNNGPALRNIADVWNRIGENYDGGQPYFGTIAEIIIYNSEVDAGAARNQIFSYLSMKYGVPILTNLVSSTNATIWDATANSTYNNSVFGLALDNTSGLTVTQATSATSGAGDGTGTSGAANIVLSNPSLSTDGSFLMVGNDNGSLSESTTGAPASPSGLNILGRRWRAANTGTPGNVTMSIDYNGLTYAGVGGNTTNFRLVVDETGANDFTTTPPTVYTPSNVSGTVVTYSNVSLPNNAVFTFGSSAVPLPVTWTSLSAGLVENNIKVSWGVENNKQAHVFQVEHSTDGATFSVVGQVANDPNVQSYSYLYTPATGGTHYFRILETDLDGRSIYSKIISINTGTSISAFGLKLLSNPLIGGTASFEVDAPANAEAIVEIWTMTGAKVLTSRQLLNSGTNRFDLPLGNVSSGNYILTVKTGNTVLHEQLSKQ